MPANLTACSAVLVAHDVNMSIFKPVWLGRQEILTDEELTGEVIVTPALVRIPTDRFELLILPDRIQIRPAPAFNKAQASLLRVLGGIVSKLPHTPFTALGFNFEYMIQPGEGIDFKAWNRQTFAAPFSPRATVETQGDVRFGGYFSMDVLDMRLRADIKPARAASGDAEQGADSPLPPEAMQAKFNFHRDLESPASVAEILAALGAWDGAASCASEFAAAAVGGPPED